MTTMTTTITVGQAVSQAVILFGSIYLFSNSVKEMNKIFHAYSQRQDRFEGPVVWMNSAILVVSGVFLWTVMTKTNHIK